MKFKNWPTVSHVVTQPFGARPEYYRKYGLPGHEGIDLVAEFGGPIFAVADGYIEYVKDTRRNGQPSAYGWHVEIVHEYGWKTLYAHLAVLARSRPGTIVKAGDIIGFSGDSGISTGPHLHFTLKHHTEGAPGYKGNQIDPWPYLAAIPTPEISHLPNE